ncbi:MAG: caspase family protein [Halioglobus sp.]
MANKYALIVGINKYPYMEEKYQLGGCVNDAKLIKSILVNKFNFDAANIVELHDEQATRDSILAEMNRLADVIAKDDIVVFHYSGHGHQCKVKSEYTDEGSGKDNCILPCDDSEPSPEGEIWREIRDYQINDWLQRLASKTRYTTLIFDACHSGTMTRGPASTATARSIPTAGRPQSRSAPLSRAATDEVKRAPGKARPGAGGWLTLNDNYVVISGCRDTQTSKEMYFTRDGESVKHGVLTYNLTHALLRAKPGTTYRDVFEPTCSGVVSGVSGQNPQIEGAIDRELFGVKDIEPLAYIPISDINGDKITLDGGAAHGLRCGSIWGIYPPGTKQAESDQSVGVLKIDHVGALSSTALVVESTGELVVGSRCVETEAVPSIDCLEVDLSGLANDAKAILQPGIEKSSLLALSTTAGTEDIRASIVDSAPLGGPSWEFYEDGDVTCMPLHRVDEPGVAKILLGNLEKIARFRNVLRLDNPNPALNVEFNLFKQQSDGELLLANGGNCEFDEKDPLVLEISNHETEKTIFFSILWISASKEIGHFYPHRKASEELSPGKTVHIGHGKNKLTAALGKEHFADVGSESCKVIFSTTESDFSWLNQESLRSSGDPDSSVAAFDAAYTGAGSDAADAQADKDKPAVEDWDAITRSFILTRTPG